jgi:hypothetical protein
MARMAGAVFRGHVPGDAEVILFLSVRPPIQFLNSRQGQERIFLYRDRLAEFLGLFDAEIKGLRDCGLILPRPGRGIHPKAG